MLIELSQFKSTIFPIFNYLMKINNFLSIYFKQYTLNIFQALMEENLLSKEPNNIMKISNANLSATRDRTFTNKSYMTWAENAEYDGKNGRNCFKINIKTN